MTMKTQCPDEEKFADYLEDRLSEDEKSQIEEHISDCEICLEEYVVSGSLVRGEGRSELNVVPSEVTRAAVRLVSGRGSIQLLSLWGGLRRSVKGLYQWLADLFNPMHSGELAYMPTRGSKKGLSNDLLRFKKTFKEIKTEIEIEKRGEGKAHIRVKLIESIWEKSIRVTLKRGEREISSDLLDNRDYVLFEDVPFGSYNLVFTREGAELGDYPFKIEDTS